MSYDADRAVARLEHLGQTAQIAKFVTRNSTALSSSAPGVRGALAPLRQQSRRESQLFGLFQAGFHLTDWPYFA